MTIPSALKLAALAVTILGLFTALELAQLTNKQFKPTPNIRPHNFSNMLGFFPALVHRFPPKVNLILGQFIAAQMVDQTWLEKSGPKAVISANLPLVTTTSNAQQGIVKTFLAAFFLTLMLALIAIAL